METLQPDPRTALAFYSSLFGWDAVGPGPMPDGGEYFVARLHDDDVAGIATLPQGGVAEPTWTTYVRVADLEASIRLVLNAASHVIVAPIEAKPAGRLAINEAPTGASLGLWEPGVRAGAQRVNESGAWAMSALHTRDVAAATSFHATVFGWNAEPFAGGNARGSLFRLPGYVGGLPRQPVPRDVVAVAIEDAELNADYWSVDFWTDDLEAAVERTRACGGTVVKPPFETTPFRRAVIACPAGAVFTVSEVMAEQLGKSTDAP